MEAARTRKSNEEEPPPRSGAPQVVLKKEVLVNFRSTLFISVVYIIYGSCRFSKFNGIISIRPVGSPDGPKISHLNHILIHRMTQKCLARSHLNCKMESFSQRCCVCGLQENLFEPSACRGWNSQKGSPAKLSVRATL